MYILLSESQPCGKTKTLMMAHDQIYNIYNLILSSTTIFEDLPTFKSEFVFAEKRVVIMENNHPIENIIDELNETTTPSDLIIIESHSDEDEVLKQRGIEFITIKKEIKNTDNGKLFSNIKDCDKILNIVEKHVTNC